MPSNESRPLAIPPELDAEMTPAERAFVGLLLDRIAKLEARVEELERGRKTPQNSSLPPSTMHPHAKPPATQRKSKKKRGGQRGHKKHERPLLPTEECDEVKPLKPTECRRCGEKLSGSDPQPLRHQVWELPEITVTQALVETVPGRFHQMLGQPLYPSPRRRSANDCLWRPWSGGERKRGRAFCALQTRLAHVMSKSTFASQLPHK